MKPHKLFVFIGLLLCGIAKADFIPMPGDDNGHLSVKVIFENPSQKIDSAACWITFMGRHTQLQAGEATYNDTGYYVPVSFEWIRPRTLSFAALHHHEPLPDTLGLILWSKGKRYELSLENRLPIAQQYFYIYADHTELNDYPQKYLWQQWLLYFVITVLVELGICAAFFFQGNIRRALSLVLLINCVTHPALFFITHNLSINPLYHALPYNFLGELFVIVIEFAFFVTLLKQEKTGRLLLFSFVANIASLALGAIIASVLY